MKRYLDSATPVIAIHALNVALIVILLIGVPAVTGVSLGSWRISSYAWLQRLVLAGLGLGVIVNLLMGWRCRPRRQRLAYRGWFALHALVLVVAALTYAGHLNFDWLRSFLHQVRRLRVGAAKLELILHAMLAEESAAWVTVSGSLLCPILVLRRQRSQRNWSISVRLGADGCAPGRVTESAAAA